MSKKFQDLFQRPTPELEAHLFGLNNWMSLSEGTRHTSRVETLLKDIVIALKELKAPREAPIPCPPSPSALLDQFALAALPAVLAACNPNSVSVDYDDIADRAYTMAKAMMRTRLLAAKS